MRTQTNNNENEKIINSLCGESFTSEEIKQETIKYNQEEAEDNLKDLLARDKQQGFKIGGFKDE